MKKMELKQQKQHLECQTTMIKSESDQARVDGHV